MILLQTETAGKIVQSSSYVILNYGAIGAILVLCIAACVAMAISFKKQWQRQEARYFAEIDKLRDQMNTYIENDHERMIKVIEDNTKALNEIRFEVHKTK